MKLILNEDVESLGSIGDIVNVKDGFGRNYLLPRGLAVPANEGNKAALQHQIRMFEKKKAKQQKEARKLAAVIEKLSVTVSKQVGEDEKIFGTVTTAELEALLEAEGVKVNRKNIKIIDDIKKVGVYSAAVKVSDIEAKFKVWVVAAQ